MSARIEIKCINKTPRFDHHLRIQNVGGINPDGKPWKLSEQQAIDGVEDGTYSFYVSRGGHTVDVIVSTHLGHKYLKTVADGLQPDNLLSLPECPL